MSEFSSRPGGSFGLPNETSPEPTFAPEEITEEILLSMVSGIGPLLTQRLLERFGDASAILDATERQLESVVGVGPVLSRQISTARRLLDVNGMVELCRKNNVAILIPSDARYPQRLREIVDPPPVIYCRGELVPEDALAISVVGTRAMSAYGREQTTRLVTQLARAGFTIVSGLARGIDGTAHTAALAAGGRTLAVLGTGILEIYPDEHTELAQRVMERGAILSELPPTAPAMRGNFPQRNRIVSGLSLGVLVVESPKKSGSLITARLATEQGRDVFAVPGPIHHENSRGCHQLIRDGAVLVESADDILDALGPLPLPIPKNNDTPTELRHPREISLNERERAVLAILETTPKPVDTVITESGLPPGAVLAVLGVLEIKRFIRRCEGNRVARI